MKDLIKIHIRVSFISIAYVVVKIKSFSYWFSILGGFFLALTPLKFFLILLKLWPVVVSNKANSVCKVLQVLHFGSNGTLLKFTVLVDFGAQFTAGKPKPLLKPKLLQKLHPQEYQKCKSQAPEKSQNSCKIKPKNNFWT